MSLVIDVSGAERHTFAPSPLGELAAMLHALVEPAHHPEAAAWGGPAETLRDRIEESHLLWRSSRADFLLPARPRATLAAELDDVDRLDDETWAAAALVTTSCGTAPRPRIGSPLTDAAARERVRGLAQARGPRQAAFADRLLADPPGVRAWVRELLEQCEVTFFAGAWSGILARLAADARQKADLAARHGLAAAVEAVSPSIESAGDRIVVDKAQHSRTTAGPDGVTFLPTVFGRPHLLVVHTPGWQPVVQYPAAADPGQVPFSVVQQRLTALAHPARQELARTLARGAHTTGELAAARNLSAPEVSRHLRVLRGAGLVTTTRRGRYVLYELDRETCSRLGSDFLAAILR